MLDTSLPKTTLEPMPQLREARTKDDDWTGCTSAAERRKLQNRLHQRNLRRRRGAKPRFKTPWSTDDNKSVAKTVIPPTQQPRDLAQKFRGLIHTVHSTPDQQTLDHCGKIIGTKITKRPSICTLGRVELEALVDKYESIACRDYISGSPRADQLLTLIQFNVFRALLKNTTTIGWSMEWLETGDVVSPWNSMEAIPPNPRCPSSLHPTQLQRTIQHHPWIDLWPIPRMRDNLLLASDSYDEDKLCNDLVEFCDVPGEKSGLIVWSEPYDPRAWEVSEAFLTNWGWAVKGCRELFESTNYWRRQRGEEELVFEI